MQKVSQTANRKKFRKKNEFSQIAKGMSFRKKGKRIFTDRKM